MRNWLAIVLALTTGACATISYPLHPWGEEGKGMYSIDYVGPRGPAVARAQDFCAQQGKVRHIIAEYYSEFVFKCVDNS